MKGNDDFFACGGGQLFWGTIDPGAYSNTLNMDLILTGKLSKVEICQYRMARLGVGLVGSVPYARARQPPGLSLYRVSYSDEHAYVFGSLPVSENRPLGLHYLHFVCWLSAPLFCYALRPNETLESLVALLTVSVSVPTIMIPIPSKRYLISSTPPSTLPRPTLSHAHFHHSKASFCSNLPLTICPICDCR